MARSSTPGTNRLPRLKAVLALREDTLEALAGRVGVGPRHIHSVFTGCRSPSKRLAAQLRAELGAIAWRFITGAHDRLEAEPFA